jgi:hypothetical protein
MVTSAAEDIALTRQAVAEAAARPAAQAATSERAV